MPIVDHAIDPEDSELPKRATLQETVDFIIRLLDEAKDCSDLPWAIYEDESDNWSGRLTRASAMGLKLRVLLFVASPLFNSDAPYYEGCLLYTSVHFTFQGLFCIFRILLVYRYHPLRVFSFFIFVR